MVYIGDQADACPYVIDTNSGEVAKLDKGNCTLEPIQTHTDFRVFLVSV